VRASVKLQKDLREFIGLLLSQGVEFLVVGGHAVAFHGYPRLTEDVDLLVRPSLENGSRILRALGLFGFGSIGLTAEDFTAPDRMIQLGRAPNRIDLLTQIWGLTFEEAWASRVLSCVAGVADMPDDFNVLDDLNRVDSDSFLGFWAGMGLALLRG
jgi:hypothetical protein